MNHRADKLILRLIASVQGLFALLWLVMVPILFNFGGAAANPTRYEIWKFVGLFGLVSALALFTRHLWARLLAAAWNGALVSVLLLSLGPGEIGGGALAWTSAWVLVAGYLAVTSGVLLADAYRRSGNRARIRRRTLWGIALAVLALIVARGVYVHSHTQQVLIAKLRSSSEGRRCSAAEKLAANGHAAAAALPQLVAILGNTTCTRWGQDQLPAYIEAIGGAEPFLELMKSDSGRAGEKAAMQLMYRDHDYADRTRLLDAFIYGLQNGNDFVRRVSAEALGTFGMGGAMGEPELLRALKDRDSRVRTAAANTLGRVRSLDGLALALASPDPNVRQVAAAWQARMARGDTMFWHSGR